MLLELPPNIWPVGLSYWLKKTQNLNLDLSGLLHVSLNGQLITVGELK